MDGRLKDAGYSTHKSKRFHIISHGQEHFERLLELDNISHEEILSSLNVSANKTKVFQAGEGAGASGSFFFFASDDRFLIKTMRGSEKTVMLNMLKSYIDHIKSNPGSLLCRIYGVFTI